MEEKASSQQKNQARNLIEKRRKGKFIVETEEEEMERGESRFEQMGSYIMKDKEETIK